MRALVKLASLVLTISPLLCCQVTGILASLLQYSIGRFMANAIPILVRIPDGVLRALFEAFHVWHCLVCGLAIERREEGRFFGLELRIGQVSVHANASSIPQGETWRQPLSPFLRGWP
jgi:hypothetical protein